MADEEELVKEPILEDTEIQEETDQEAEEHNKRFEVSSYGWDVDVEGLVKRMNRGDIFVPGFQRGFGEATVVEGSRYDSVPYATGHSGQSWTGMDAEHFGMDL